MRSHDWHDTKITVGRIRDRAEEIRGSAAEARNSRIRASMLNIAKTYDNTADILMRILTKNDGIVGDATG